MTGYDAAAWHALFAAEAGAAPIHRAGFVISVIIGQVATLSFVVAGISLIAGAGGDLYWAVPGVLFCFGGAVLNAWVLLIEIVR